MVWKKWALALLKPSLTAWLTTRALVLPAAQQQALAAKISQATGGRVSVADAITAIQMAQTELVDLVVAGVDSIL